MAKCFCSMCLMVLMSDFLGPHPGSGTSQHASLQGIDVDHREVGKKLQQVGGSFGSQVGKHLLKGAGHRDVVTVSGLQ